MVLLIVFPVGVAIETQNVVLTLVGIGISCISIFFSFSALILIGERVNRVLQGNDINTPKTTIIRVSTMLGIGLDPLESFFYLN